MRRLWELWKAIAEKIGRVQSRVVLVLLYFVVVTPFALFVKIGKDPLRIKPQGGSNWIERQTPPGDLKGARRQF